MNGKEKTGKPVLIFFSEDVSQDTEKYADVFKFLVVVDEI